MQHGTFYRWGEAPTRDVCGVELSALLLEQVAGQGGQGVVHFVHQVTRRQVGVAQQAAGDDCGAAGGAKMGRVFRPCAPHRSAKQGPDRRV